ncbi:hypothetical protein XPR_3723 [Xanthomonas arboricola pv. pruni MAFF 301420]|uniref:Uncharacterized protein n=2 Tax=Xanthomonas arboricola pv. pruni TaxID=69929 RepID=W4SLN9_9XANT|nr:hypothetical protein XPU_4409 [Xanthomonas arboricola pv. pruni str. MAFF 311562]GAE57088.1 hypothetical protein XPR_3723 [Xanthomonas arboricola pv. pruni MAFF 301420]GAE61771.1 hypothetical protein XPN_3677 [Xanthomonas arboricola pv. pruni MAFF 301427]
MAVLTRSSSLLRGYSLDFDFDFDFDADDRAIGALRSPTPETSQASAAFSGSRSAIQPQRCKRVTQRVATPCPG